MFVILNEISLLSFVDKKKSLLSGFSQQWQLRTEIIQSTKSSLTEKKHGIPNNTLYLTCYCFNGLSLSLECSFVSLLPFSCVFSYVSMYS